MEPPKTFRFSDLIVLAAWFGLVYGLLEAILLLSLYEFSRLAMWNNGVAPPILWIGPCVNLLLFLISACGLAVLYRLLGSRRNQWSWPLSLAVFSGLTVMGLLLSPRSLKWYGCAALGLGAGVQAFLWARKHFSMAFFRRTLALAGAAVLLAGIVGEAIPRIRERRFLGALPPAKSGRPNVLLIVLDTLRADHVSAYGYSRATTPNLDRIAKQGMLFERAFSPSTNSPTSHLEMLSGKAIGGDWYVKAQDGRYSPLLAETLAGQGYATAVVAANYMWVTPKIGLGRGVARFDLYFHTLSDMFSRVVYGKGLAQLARRWFTYDDPGNKRAGVVNQQLLKWIDDTRSTGRPFFGLVNYFDPHDPYWAPPAFRTKFSQRVTRRNLLAINVDHHPSSGEVQLLRDAYDAEVAYLDSCLGELRRELERRGQWNNTLLILTADHGEAFGEQGRFGHVTPILRQEVVHVPMILHYPAAVPVGVRVAAPVSGRQIPATVAGILGLPLDSYDDKRSLLDYQKHPEGPVIIENGENFAAVLGKWHLIHMMGEPEHLYDLDADPQEQHDLMGRPEMAATADRLRGELSAWARQHFGSSLSSNSSP